MASSRPTNGYAQTPSPIRPLAATDGQHRSDLSRPTYSASRPLPQPSGPRSQPTTSYLPVAQQPPATVPSSSPSELKRRRPPSQLPSAFTLGSDGVDGGLSALPDTDKFHPSDGEFISRDDYPHSSSSPLLSNPASSSSSPSTAYRTTRRDSDPDDKYKHTFLRRLLMRFLPYKPTLQSHTSKSHHSRHLSLEKGLGSHSVKPVSELWDSERPVASALRILFAVCAVVVLVTVFTLLVHGGPTALLYVTHPFSHLLSPFSATPQPSISPLSTSSASSSAPSIYTPELLSAVTPSLSSSAFTIVASFYINEQSSPSSTRLLQWHSLLSFVALTPPDHIIVYTNQPTTCVEFVHKAFPAIQCFYLPDYFNVEFQLPYVDRLLSHAHSHSLDDLIVYTHHDVLLSADLSSSLHHLMDVLPYHQFAASSKRLDTRLPFELVSLTDFSRSHVDDIIALGRAMNRVYHNEWNIDLLVYSKYWFEQLTASTTGGSSTDGTAFPPFVFSDYYWSNHLLGLFLLSPHLTTVDLSSQRLLFHIKSNDTTDGIYVNDMRSLSQNNLRLARNASDRYLYGQLNNIPYQLTGRCPACHLQLSGSGSIDLLARKQAEHGWLIILEMGEKDAGRVWNWLCWAERANVSNYLLVTDSTAVSDYRQMYELGFPILFTDGSDGSIGLIGYLLQKGYSVLTMDLDHLMLQAPWSYLQASPFDVMVKGDDANFYAGILALRGSHYSHYFYSAVTQCTAASSTHGADVLAGCAARTFRDIRLQVKGGLLDILHFPTVKTFFVDQLSQRTGTYPLVLETSQGWLDELGLNIYKGGGQCESAQRQPFEPFSTDTPIVVRILTSTNLPGLKALLTTLSSAQYEVGAVVRLEVAIDYPRGNVSASVLELYQQVVSYASSYVFSQGAVLVSMQDEQHVGSARLLVADHDEASDAHVLLLSDDVQLSSMWHVTLSHLLPLFALRTEPQLMGVALTVEDVVLGETHVKRSSGRHAMDEVDTLLGSTAMYGWQQPSPAVLLFPGFYHELLYFVDRMQSAYPNYHPCVPTLITNHRRRYLEFLSKWMYTRGTYLLYLNLPDRHVLATQSEHSAAAVLEPRYTPKLLNLQTYTQLHVGELTVPSVLRVFDFHLVERASGVLESRAAVERRSKQCWVQGDWKDEADAIQMDEDELMSEAEEQRRHALHRERQSRKQSELAALAAQHHTTDRDMGPAVAEMDGHKVAREAVAGVRVAGSEGKGVGAKKGEWEEAAARDIAESQAHNLALAMKEVKAGNADATQPVPSPAQVAAAAPAAPAPVPAPAPAPAAAPAQAAIPVNQAPLSNDALNEALKKVTPEQRKAYDQLMKNQEAQKAAGTPPPV